MNYQPDIEEIIFILGDVLKLKVLSGVEMFADYDWEELPNTLQKEIAEAEELLTPLKKNNLEQSVLKDGLLRLPPEFKEAWKNIAESNVLKIFLSLKDGGNNLPLSLSLPVKEMLGILSPAFYCCLTSTMEIAELIEQYGSEEQKKMCAPKLLSGLWSGAFAFSEPYSDLSWDNIRTEAIPAKGYYSISGDKTMVAVGGHDLTDNIIYLVLARIKQSDNGDGNPALFVVPAYHMENQQLVDNNVRLQSVRPNNDPNDIFFASLSYGQEGECRGYLLKETELGTKNILKALQNFRLSAALQAAAQITKISASIVSGLGEKPDALKNNNLINDYPRSADAVMYMQSLSEGIRIAVYSAYFLTDCGFCSGQDQDSFFHDVAELYSLVLKVYATETGLQIIDKATRTLGAVAGVEKFYGRQSRDNFTAGIFMGTFNGIATEQLLDYTLNIDEGRKFNSLMERFKMLDDQQPLTPELSESLNVWKDYAGGLIILADDLKQNRKSEDYDISKMFADKVARLFAEVIVGYYLIIQGLEAETKLKKAGVSFYNLRQETKRRPELLKWYNKIISAEYFSLNILSLRENSVHVLQKASASALKALWS